MSFSAGQKHLKNLVNASEDKNYNRSFRLLQIGSIKKSSNSLKWQKNVSEGTNTQRIIQPTQLL